MEEDNIQTIRRKLDAMCLTDIPTMGRIQSWACHPACHSGFAAFLLARRDEP